MQDRRTFRGLLGASSAAGAVPARAGTADGWHDRAVVEFGPRPLDESIHERLDALIERLSDAGGGTVGMTEGV